MRLRRSIILAISAVACAFAIADESVLIDDIRNTAEAAEVEKLALKGDTVSMLRLVRYFANDRADAEEASRWLWLAAKHGDCFAVRESIKFCDYSDRHDECRRWEDLEQQHCQE